MRSVKVRIAKEADCELSFEIVAPAIPKKVALYMNAKQSFWLMDEEKALEVIKNYGDDCMAEMIGHTDYMIIFPSESAVNIDGNNFVMGECLIMKAGNKSVECMSLNEMEEAFVEFISRTISVYAGQYELPAYQVD
ncbi:MAG: hypothetical protein IIV45_12115 [Lachnospiraceae bacterium]|nr:hypothetical protein [Lachnospiraceae bacterium]